MIKKAIVKLLASHQYPQNIFGKEISSLISASFGGNISILDCPCGNGETSFALSKIKHAQVLGVDIDKDSISRAHTNFKRNNLAYLQSDIFDHLSAGKKYDVVCMINSLFLLPDHFRLFDLVKKNLNTTESKFILIIPNTDAPNYKNFVKNNPAVNKYEIKTRDLEYTLEQSGFRVNTIKEIVYINYYGRQELRYFSVLAPVYLTLRNFLRSFKTHLTGNYILISCSILPK